MWFDVSGNFSPKSSSTWWEASCRMSTKNCGHSSPCARSRMLIFCALDLSSPHISPPYHHNVTFSQMDPNGTAISPGAISLQQVQPWFFLFSQYLTKYSLTLGSRVHNSIHQSDHRHGIHEPQFVVASRRFGLWIEVRIVEHDLNETGSDVYCNWQTTSGPPGREKESCKKSALMRRKRDVESSSDLNVLQWSSMYFNVHYSHYSQRMSEISCFSYLHLF